MSSAQFRVVADRYRLVEMLGQGGMGRVWMARDELLHRDVAIKELIPPSGLTGDERQEMRERTMREARAIARLSHPNVVRIFDILRSEGEPWIVMEYVRSRSLQEVLAQDGPLPPRRVAEIGLGMLAALRAAHRAGVVHRDVKPGNVLLGDDGRVVLTDFGLATVPGDPVVTRTGLVLGSPAYIAPERAHDGTAGPAADMWSLGATLYAAVEGQSPYARPSAIATLAALATEPPAPARRAGPLKPVLNGLLRKEPAERILAAEAERQLVRAAGRRTRGGVPLLPGARRPFAEGYLPRAHPAPSAAPVVAAVAPVPPQRKPGVEPDEPADMEPRPADDGTQVREAGPVEPGRQQESASPDGAVGPAPVGAEPVGAEQPPEVEPAGPEVLGEPEPARGASPTTRKGSAVADPPAQAVSVLPTPTARPVRPGQAGLDQAGPEHVEPDRDLAGGGEPVEPAEVGSPAPTAGPGPAGVTSTGSAGAPAGLPAVPGADGAPDGVRPGLVDRLRAAPARVRAAVVAALGIVAVAVVLVVVLPGHGPGAGLSANQAGSPAARASATPAAAPTSGPPSPSPTPAPTADAAALPSGWHMYRDRSGFTVAVPKNWRIERDRTIVYFREQSGQYRVLAIDRSDYPKPDPVKDWKQQESQRAHLKRNYSRIRIQAVDYFQAAADWEYTYDQAAPLHAINRGFVTGPHQAHAILWITPERTWQENLKYFDLITSTFQPIAP